MEKQFVICLAVLAIWYLLFMTPFVLITVSSFIAFVFLGMIPFIDYTAPPEVMFLIYAGAAGALLIFAKETGYYPGSPQIKKAVRMANAKEIRRFNRRLAHLNRSAAARRNRQHTDDAKVTVTGSKAKAQAQA